MAKAKVRGRSLERVAAVPARRFPSQAGAARPRLVGRIMVMRAIARRPAAAILVGLTARKRPRPDMAIAIACIS